MMLELIAGVILTSEPDTERLYEAALPKLQPGVVSVVHQGGDCTVLPAAKEGEARAELRVTVSGQSTGQEAIYLDQIRLVVDLQENGLTVRPEFPAPETKPTDLSLAANLTLWLPADTELHVDSRYGSVDVRGMKRAVTVHNRLGPVQCRDLGADLTVTNEYDRVEVQNVAGRVEVRNSEQVTVTSVGGAVRIENKFGAVRVIDAGGEVFVENRNAPIEVVRAPAGVEVIAPYCRVNLEHVGGRVQVSGNNESLTARHVDGSLTIDHRHGELRISDIGSDLIVRGSFIPMTVRRVGGDVEIRCTASSVSLDSVTGSALVEGETGSMELRDVRGGLEASGKGGLMLVELARTPTAGSTGYRLQNRGSPMELVVPEELSCTLTVRSTLGVIESEFPSLQTEKSGRVRIGTLVLGTGETNAEGICMDGAIRIRRAANH